ncbi:XrtA/PEP-CTERM system TPR-repeat protein PrsT [Motilimonas sp. E26]|uniref:XrtA/PEP-CTERM system TPR-repeat protein PrsT n=1 Tax=Motilimonas sp. E26 TaxID=2865674 RepID=UPI001E4CBB36|nr:PEP-CTERM system TPR-repeat protein PrsT [Motilimonas sp. E26]
MRYLLKVASIVFFHCSLCLGALLLSACGGPSTAEHKALAEQYLQQQDWTAAAYHLKQSIQQDGKQGSVRLQLGKLYLRQFQLDNAIKELRMAKALGLTAALPPLAQAYSWQGKYADILHLPVNAQAPYKEQAELLMLKIEAALVLDPLADVERYLETLSQIAPSSREFCLAQAYYWLAQRKLEQAQPWLEKALALNPIDQRSLWLQAKTLYSLKQYDDSAKTLVSLLALSPTRVSYYLLAVDVAFAMGDLELAEHYINQVEDLDNKQPQHIFNQAYLALQHKNFTQAIALTDKLLLIQEHYGARLISGISHYYLSNWEQAYSQFARTAAQLPSEHIVQQLMADVLLKLGQVEQSAEVANAANWHDVNQLPLLLSLSSGLQQHGQVEMSQRLLHKAQRMVEAGGSGELNTGIIQLLSGDLEAGIASLEVALNDANDSEASSGQVLLFNAYLTAEKWLQAERLALSLFNTPETRELSYQMQTVLLLKQQQWDSALQLLQRALSERPNATGLLYLSARTQFFQGNIMAARATIEQLLQLQPDSQQGLKLATLIDLKNHQIDLAIERLSQQSPVSLSVANRLLLARLYLLHQQPDAALTLLMEMPNQEKLSQTWQFLVAMSHQHLQHWSQAEQSLMNLLSAQGLTEATLLPLAQVMLMQNQYAELLAVLEQYPLLDSSAYQALYVRLLIQQQRWSQAKIALRHAKMNFPNQAATFNHLLLQLTLARGESQTAEQLLEQRMQQQFERQEVLDLVHIYRNRQPDKALLTLELGLKQFPKDLVLLQTQAQLLWHLGKIKQAQSTWRYIITLQPNDVIALNNLAWLSYQNGKIAEGLSLIETAYQHHPNHHKVLDTYSALLVAQSRYPEAIVLLESIPEASREKSMLLHLAQAYYGNNDYGKAKRVLDELSLTEMEASMRIEVQALRAMIDANLRTTS